jgi:ABC-2 type transport system permease protein
MRNILLVMKNEIITVVMRRSFFMVLILVPLVPFIFLLIAGQILKSQPEVSFQQILAPNEVDLVEGFVDEAGLILEIPANASEDIRQYPNNAEANTAIKNGEINAYYRLPVDFLESGQLYYYRNDFNPMAGLDRSAIFQQVINYNLLGRDAQLTGRFNQPVQLQREYLAAEPQRDMQNQISFFLPYMITVVYYMLILGSSSMMLSSIAKEKENSIMEVLMTSVTPLQLLAGKMIGLGVVGLLQTVFWSLCSLLLIQVSGRTFSLPPAMVISPMLVVWGALFFILGYFLYASLMSGVGALVTRLREGSQATTILMIPLMIPLFLIGSLIDQPNGTIAIVFSLFPLTAPVVMMTRLSAASVPWWQLLLAVVLLVVTIIVVIRSVAAMFQAQFMLSGQAFKSRTYFRLLLRGR